MESNNRPPYYSITDFPQLHELHQNWLTIQMEFLQINAPLMNVHREGQKYKEVIGNVITELQNGNEYGWIRGWGKDGGNDDWIQFGVLSYNSQVNAMLEPFVSSVVPRTLSMLKKIEGIKICAFVKLKAHSMLPCHTHPEIYEESLLQFHLPIITAHERNYAYLNVSGEFRQHECGIPIIFDGSLDHFAINESSEDRTILYIEFKRL
jgi:aspartyl/asparaginyl beta-hydroxylase (cupin superfamily)